MATELPNLKCGACGHENEPERVYCHSCGAKLDRSVLPKLEPAKEDAEEAKKHKRVKKMMSAGRGAIKRDIKVGISVLILAAAVGALYLFWQTPAGVPPDNSNVLPDRDAGELWERMMAAPNALAVTFTDVELNAYLKRAIKSSESSVPGVKFKRAFLTLDPELLTLTVERDMWGFKQFSSVSYRPSKDGQYAPEVAAVNFGRLALHPLLKIAGEFSIGSVGKAFKKEMDGLSRVANAKVDKGSITVTTKALP